MAEQLYAALQTWSSADSIEVTSTSQPFFAQFAPSITPGTYPSTSTTATSLISAIRSYADSFIAINAQYTPSDGGLSEQFSKSDGTPVSAVDLTWSYASAITAFQASEGIFSNSWGAKGLTAPNTCSTSNPLRTVAVTFQVQATTVFGRE